MKGNDQQTITIKLTWCSPHPNHYNSYLFDHLAALEGLSFKAVYFAQKITKYPWNSSIQASYTVYYLKRFLGVDWSFLFKKKSRHELLVVAGWNEPTMLLMLLWFSFSKRPFILYSDTPDLRPRSGFKQAVRKKILDYIFRRVFRFLVTGTPGVENAEQLGIERKRIVNFPFATNINFFVPKIVHTEDVLEQLSFISSGRLDNAHKAFDLAIEAFHLLKTRHPELKFQYTIAGEGPDRKILEELIHRYELTSEVVLKGWLEPIDLLVFYRSGDVFLHPSHSDPFPNAVLEAMSCGLPVIGSLAAGSVKDRVREHENGYVHQDGDLEDLYQKIVQMLQLPKKERETMGMRSRETAVRWDVSYHIEIIKDTVQSFSKEIETNE